MNFLEKIKQLQKFTELGTTLSNILYEIEEDDIPRVCSFYLPNEQKFLYIDLRGSLVIYEIDFKDYIENGKKVNYGFGYIMKEVSYCKYVKRAKLLLEPLIDRENKDIHNIDFDDISKKCRKYITTREMLESYSNSIAYFCDEDFVDLELI